ncbi:S9 family peptidase [Flexibacterium corallicola]|uniref:S9 family peptidase n=1 Tax=Flexibacterium corallicola TaxID=3037259 RepID=UPI00286F0599|nr:S9 family peptidase [Pseudovibrio sp. M1P-2-3]
MLDDVRHKEKIDLIPRKALFDPVERRIAKISPCGEWIAFQAALDGVINLWLLRTDNLDSARPLTRFTDKHIGLTVEWSFDSRRILITHDSVGDETFSVLSVDIHTSTINYLSPASSTSAYVQQLSRKYPNEVLVAHNGRSPKYFDLYKISLDTGASELVQQNDGFHSYVTDNKFNVRLIKRFTQQGEGEYLHRPEGNDWKRYALIPLEDSLTTRPIGYSEDGKELFWIDSRNRDKAAAVAEHTQTGVCRVIAQDPQADLYDLVLAPQTGQPIAASSTYARTKWHVLDPKFEQVFDALSKALPGDIVLTSLSDDMQKLVIAHVQDQQPVAYFLVSTKTRRIKRLFCAQPKLSKLPLARMSPKIVKARDGLELICYLTRPENTKSPLPMVLVVHGGPWMRDSWGLNPTHQWLANRGYAVLSVNYRGSLGFGKAFVNASNREWGGKMQTDLMDAVDWAIVEGIADPKRIAIMGGSYGGYASLLGLTLTPDKFCCAVDLVGISNLVTFLETIPAYWEAWKSVYKARLGDFTTEEGLKFLMERSPIHYVDRIKKPLLIVQGGKDVRVKSSESEQIVSALQQYSIPVIYAVYPDEGHSIQKKQNRRSYHAVVEHFLMEHLGGRCEPVGGDFEGSSLQFSAGRELLGGI